MNTIPIGSAHGRFQPLHNEHLEYLIESKKRCDYLWIGITQHNIKSLYKSPKDPHRETPANNPFTYFERVEMITDALQYENISHNEFGFIPFPIGDDDSLTDFIPNSIPIFTIICDRWNKYKIKMLKGKGYRVIVLKERHGNIITGSQIRKRIFNGDIRWKTQVPQATIKMVKKSNLKERLQRVKE